MFLGGNFPVILQFFFSLRRKLVEKNGEPTPVFKGGAPELSAEAPGLRWG